MGRTIWKVLVLHLFIAVASSQQHDSLEQLSPIRPTPQPTNQAGTLIPLKHRRYKSYRSNTTETQRTSSPTTTHVVNLIPDEELLHDPHFNHFKSPRSGLQLQKSPPDLQFGLAFTVPFVSLSTEKLLHSVSGKNFDSVSSLLKLNFSGLLLAAVVGIVAVAGLFLPSILGPGGLGGLGGLGGWGSPWLDGLAPHFTGEQYNDYENGWSKNGGGWNNKEFHGRNGRGLNGVLASVLGKVRSGVEHCVVERVCEEVKGGNKGRLVEFVNEVGRNELVKDVGVVRLLRGVVDGDYSQCPKKKQDCGAFKNVEELIGDVVGSWGNGDKQ